MKTHEAIALALGSLRNNKMRSFLTLLGIIVGISSVITILTLGHSLKTQASQSIVSSGANDLSVQVVPRPDENETAAANANQNLSGLAGGNYTEPDAESKFTAEDIDLLKQAMGNNIAGIPLGGQSSTSVNMTSENSSIPDAYINFVNMDYLELNPKTLLAGRSITQNDIDKHRPVVLISTDQLGLFNGDPQQAVGSEIDVEVSGLGSVTAVVIGVYSDAAANGVFGMGGLGASFMPYTMEPTLVPYNADGWNYITVRPAEGKDLAQVKALLQAQLASMYRSNKNFTAEIQDYSAATESFNQVLDGISAAISAIAGISLLVGGIGVMNIMLVTVTERTREIGIRKALGATRGAIRLQFVTEAMMICLVGGVIGVLLGGALGMVGAQLLGTLVLPPVSAVLLALGFSLAIGLFFGYYPANKASKLSPIDALRYE